jgi:hypothetical protein
MYTFPATPTQKPTNLYTQVAAAESCLPQRPVVRRPSRDWTTQTTHPRRVCRTGESRRQLAGLQKCQPEARVRHQHSLPTGLPVPLRPCMGCMPGYDAHHKELFEKLSFKLFRGDRVPAWIDSKNKKPNEGDMDYANKLQRHLNAHQRWEKAVKMKKNCAFTANDKALVDRRIKNLVGPPNWIKNSMVRLLLLHVFTYMIIHLHLCTNTK